tara:strand:- start:2623 stop:3216 length:594 start_codon:yes stop_codon:yes gene_type:complete
MQNKVQIIADELGNVIRVSQNNQEYGYVRLSDNSFQINNGFMQKKEVTTLLHGKVEDLREMGIQNMKELQGKIVVKEQLEPFSSTNSDRDLKIAGKTGIICCVDGQPIYRKTMFTADITAEDIMLDHTNGSDIREANAEVIPTAKKTKITPDKSFEVDNQVDLEESINEIDSLENTEDDLEEELEEEIVEDDSAFEL